MMEPSDDKTTTPASRLNDDVSGRPADTPMRATGAGAPAASGFDFNHPTIVSLLYLASYVTGITGIVGLVLAYVWRDDAGTPGREWEASHYAYLIRTFWFGLLASVVGIVLSVIGIGLLILLAAAVWVAVRSVLSLVRAQKREPMPDPKTLLF